MVCHADGRNRNRRGFHRIFGLENWLWSSTLAATCSLHEFLLKVIEPPILEQPQASKGMSAYGEGLRFMIQRPAIWTMAAAKVGWNCVGAVTLMLTIMGERQHTIAENAIMGASFFYMMRGMGTRNWSHSVSLSQRLRPRKWNG